MPVCCLVVRVVRSVPCALTALRGVDCTTAEMGVVPGYPFIKTNSTTWDKATVMVKFERHTRSKAQFVFCSLFPRDLNVSCFHSRT